MPPPARGEVPVVKTGKKTSEEIIIARTDAYLTSKQPLEITTSEVYEKVLNDPAYFLLSIQAADDYQKGHVPGAANIPYYEIARKENLAKLPSDKKIVVICYIGHYGGAVSMFLNQLGYEAYDMQYGTMGWNDTTDGLGPRKPLLPSIIRSQEYMTIDGCCK
jgi:rhodanese-related sulfurtransferase